VSAPNRPRLLDLFCGAGGAAMGYHRAGFDVYGVDIMPQPRYPFWFQRADALTFPLDGFDFIHASPPCQAYSDLAHRTKRIYPALIEPIRAHLLDSGLPFVIENVDGAPLNSPTVLCGQMFGLRLIRHRLFETSLFVWQPEDPPHPLVYTTDKRKHHYGQLDEMTAPVSVNGGGNCSVEAARDAMGIDWMTKAELNEAIPPAYTEYVGRQLLVNLRLVA
jgi:DNA (cytosine-5)-methyltransferase 1